MLPETTREAAERFGDATAYVTAGGWKLSYRALDHISDEVAAGLAARGIGSGDVVALVLAPGPEYLISYLAAAKLGALSAGVNDRLTPAERAAVLDRAAPTLVVASPEIAPGDFDTVVVEAAAGPDDLLAPLRPRDASPPPPLPPDPDRLVAIVFTSGTTGMPKGALYGDRQLEFITRIDTGGAWGGGGHSYIATSFAHLGFMTKLPGSLRRGGTNFIFTRWRARDALRLVSEQRMSTIAGVPSQVALMLREPDFDGYDLGSVQYLVVGGGPITPRLAEEARARFRAKLATRYSCTEAGIGLGTAFDDPAEDAAVSVGRPHPAVDLSVRATDGTEVAPGEVGEVCLRSPAMMTSYWRDPDATAAVFTGDGFVRTGDLGWVDQRDRLRLVGRSTEMYVRGGYNVHPVEVEAVLSTHPAVAAVAIVPRPDDVMGEIGVAIVVPRDAATPPDLNALREYGAERLARHKLPEALSLVDNLPLTAGEKVDRALLARRFMRP